MIRDAKRRVTLVLSLLIVCAGLIPALSAARTSAQAGSGLTLEDFEPIATGGFGDRQNGWAWSMAWWSTLR